MCPKTTTERWQLKYWYTAADVRLLDCRSAGHVRHAADSLPVSEGGRRLKAVSLLNGFLWELLR